MKQLAACVFLLVCGGMHVFGSPLRAGVAVVDITPPVGEVLSGYDVPRRSEVIHDRLFARVLVLRTEDTTVALITSDLYELYLPTLIQRIRRNLGIEHTILSSSHDHSAPVLTLYEPRDLWSEEVVSKLYEAVKEADTNLFTAEISWGRGALIGGHDIRITQDDGTVRERWSDPKDEGTVPNAPIDPTVTAFGVNDTQGRLRAVFVHYACEPSSFGPDSHEVSADFPGAMVRFIKDKLGRNVVCLFSVGAAANIYPFRARLKGLAADRAMADLGRQLGEEVVRIVGNLNSASSENELQIREDILTFRNRWHSNRQMEVGVTTVLINRKLALVAVPGDMFVELQLAMDLKSPISITLLVGDSYSCGDSWAGYIPTIAASVKRGFGAGKDSIIQLGAGDRIVDKATIQIYRFLGKLDDLPRGPLVIRIPDLASP
jgi:hypothetical protein